VVRAKRAEDERWVVDCPYCGHEHRHGAEAGDRVAHCHKGDYVITEPVPRRAKLPFRRVWDRDDWRCVTCGTHKNLTVDHIIPVSKGGTDDLDNLQTMCGPCNSRKGNRT
jgi:5-methylcytosine-specific restriction endonuclease McrA